MSGILCAIKLREAGITDLTLYEKAERLGGTWRENTYPGLCCDVPSHLYSYSFEPNPDWTHWFSPGSEIRTYFDEVAKKYDLDPLIRYNREITRCELEDGRWHLTTQEGEEDIADFVICATGVLHHPVYPDYEGLDCFEGAMFHSARWDHGVPLEGRRVGVVGTGSSAVQIVSAIVDRVARLSLFQRTAQWIFPVPNPAYSQEDKDRFRKDPSIMKEMRDTISETFANSFSNAVIDASSEKMKEIQETCRLNLESSVRDPDLKRKLTPDYRAGCKRLVISADFYDAVQKPNAELVTEDIERIEPSGVRTSDGRLHELDVLVLATGFNAHQFVRPMAVIGRDGVTLDEVWSDSTLAYRSVSVPGFPNFFMMIGPNSPVGNFSLIEVAEMQFNYILQLIDLVRTGRCRQIAARKDATARFSEALVKAAKDTIWVTGCKSWYLDESGIPATWPWTFGRYQEEMREPDLDDFELAS
jgi:cation diffusion facilitator CzcD-associated flavoprotein CzcO